MNSGPCRSEAASACRPGRRDVRARRSHDGGMASRALRAGDPRLQPYDSCRAAFVSRKTRRNRRGGQSSASCRPLAKLSSAGCPLRSVTATSDGCGAVSGFRVRDADGRGCRRLAGLCDPPERLRPRVDRAGGVHPVAAARAAGGPDGRSDAARAALAVSILAEAVIAGLLLLVTIDGARQLWPFLTLAALAGVIQAFGQPAGRSLTPEIVPIDLLAGALALRSVAGQLATVAGPALGGLLSQSGPRRPTSSPL